MADILIVEDDQAIVHGLRTNFEFEGHQVRHAADGREALRQIDARLPDLLVLDIMLPGGANGFELCRRIRGTHPRVPILMLTARSDVVDKALGLDLGADDYMTKPFSLTELLARVRALLRRAGAGGNGAEPPTALTFANVAIDFSRFVATRDAAPVHLTAKEFFLLQQLAAARGAVVRRDELINRVWGEDVNVTTRTVDTHVLSLRQKLEVNPSEPRHLLTVHGVGYRFVPNP